MEAQRKTFPARRIASGRLALLTRALLDYWHREADGTERGRPVGAPITRSGPTIDKLGDSIWPRNVNL
jgi:hypothetical protein